MDIVGFLQEVNCQREGREKMAFAMMHTKGSGRPGRPPLTFNHSLKCTQCIIQRLGAY